MIKKTLEYYRNEFYFSEANLSDTNIIPLLENVISSFDIQKIRISFYNFSKNKNRIIIKADEEKLTIAFRNLISNALKYSPADKNILVSIDETEKFYKIGVRDFGVGMKKEDMQKIFEPFSRIDSSRSKKTGGYGLGLAIVKKIIDLHNAFIEVKSELNEGTEMIVGFRKTDKF
jgi:signal transduction histidine kinase